MSHGRLTRFLNWLTWGRVLLLGLAAASIMGAQVFLLAPRQYAADTTILMSDRPDLTTGLLAAASAGGGGGGGGALSLLTTPSDPMQRLESLLRSRSVRRRLLTKYDLPARLGCSEPTALRWLEASTQVRRLGKASALGGGGVGMSVQVTCFGPARWQGWLRRRAPFTTQEARRLCADLANAYVVALDAYVTQSAIQSAQDSGEFIAKRQKEVQAKLDQAATRLQELQVRYRLLNPDSKAQQLLGEYRTVGEAYANAAAKSEGLVQSLSQARASLSQEDRDRIAQSVTERNPVISTLDGKLAQLRIDLAQELNSGKSAGHPDVQETQVAIADLERQLQQVAQDVQSQITRASNPVYDQLLGKIVDMEVGLVGSRAQEATYDNLLTRLNTEVDRLPLALREYMELSAQVQMQSDLLAALTKRQELAAIEARQESSGKFRVLDPAEPPDRKSGPSPVQNAGLAFVFVSGLLALLLAHHRGLFREEEQYN